MQPPLSLPAPLPFEPVHHNRGRGDFPPPAVLHGEELTAVLFAPVLIPVLGLDFDLLELPADQHGPLFKIHIVPFEAQYLPLAHTRKQGNQKKELEGAPLDCLDELVNGIIIQRVQLLSKRASGIWSCDHIQSLGLV